MKANKVIKNILKNGIHIITIFSVFIVILQLKQNQKDNQLAIQDITNSQIQEEVKIAENNTEQVESREKIQEKVTARHSISRKKKSEEPEEVVIIEEVIEEVIEEKQYTKIENIKISRDMDLTVRTGISKEDFKKLISNVKYDTSKFFYDNSDFIYDLCEEYQINEIFFCGLISAESGWNIASNHRRTHNYISLMTKNGLIAYGSVEEGLIAAAKALHNNYLTEGGRFYNGKTLYGVKTKFCPASSTWVELVYGRMQQITKYI